MCITRIIIKIEFVTIFKVPKLKTQRQFALMGISLNLTILQP